MSKIYALLVGINEYSSPGISKLQGCVNDVDHFHKYLNTNFGPEKLSVKILKDSAATYENIINQFRSQLGQAKGGDVAVFQYCGHGAHATCAPEFRELNGDGRDEGLVCVDSREPGGYDLADKELAVLISEVAQNNPHIAVILDCCHSGSGTRDGDASRNMRIRTAPQHTSGRSLESYIGGYYAELRNRGEAIIPPQAKHVLLAACNAKQTAKEDSNTHNGIFTSSLIEALEERRGELSYSDLLVSTRKATRSRISDQDPRIEALDGFDAEQGFLGKGILSRRELHRVYFDQENWNVELGAMKGVPAASGPPILLDIFPEDGQGPSIGSASITHTGPATSRIQLAFQSNMETEYRAKLASASLVPVSIFFDGPNQWHKILQDSIGTDFSIAIELVDAENSAPYSLIAEDHLLILKQTETGLTIQSVNMDNYQSDADIEPLLSALKKLVSWERGVRQIKSATLPEASKVDFIFNEKLDDGSDFPHDSAELTFDYRETDNGWRAVIGKFQVCNRTADTIHASLLYYSNDFGITVLGNQEIEPHENFVTLWGGTPDDGLTLDDETGEQMSVERLKLIVSLQRIDDFLLVQNPIGPEKSTRKIGKVAGAKVPDDWFIKDCTIRLVRRPKQAGQVFGDEEAVLLDGRMRIKRHGSIKGNAGLSTVAPASRSDGSQTDFVRQFARIGIPLLGLPQTGARGEGEPVILELTDIENSGELEDNPLDIELDIPLAQDETILPVVYDGKHILLGGDAYYQDGTAHISINQIPDASDPNAITGERSLGSALKLYFFKTYLQKNVNRLRWVNFKSDRSVELSEDQVAEKVAHATNILLLVHGIIGDTENIAAGFQGCNLHDMFDLVLAFDYENLNTPIDRTAIDLKTKLAAVGLKEGDEKRLTILAHSMGGLVSRSFIERERGDKIVDHLVMCGTPNHGSPFGKIDDARKILNLLTVVSMNFIPALLPFSSPFLMILNRTKKLTLCLEQMDPDSEFLQSLNNSDDPGIPYTIIAGDIDSYHEPTDKLFSKLLEKAGKSAAFDQLFADKPNDIAVGVESIRTIGTNRAIGPVFSKVSCHHLNYFSSEAGQAALKSVNWLH